MFIVQQAIIYQIFCIYSSKNTEAEGALSLLAL